MSPEKDPARPHRRHVLRGAVWVPPVIVATTAAPAFAASVGPLTVTGSKGVTSLILTFSGGETTRPATISSVKYTLLGVTNTVTMSPNPVTNTAGGQSFGNLLSSALLATVTYTVVYVYAGQTFTTTVVA